MSIANNFALERIACIIYDLHIWLINNQSHYKIARKICVARVCPRRSWQLPPRDCNNVIVQFHLTEIARETQLGYLFFTSLSLSLLTRESLYIILCHWLVIKSTFITRGRGNCPDTKPLLKCNFIGKLAAEGEKKKKRSFHINVEYAPNKRASVVQVQTDIPATDVCLAIGTRWRYPCHTHCTHDAIVKTTQREPAASDFSEAMVL